MNIFRLFAQRRLAVSRRSCSHLEYESLAGAGKMLKMWQADNGHLVSGAKYSSRPRVFGLMILSLVPFFFFSPARFTILCSALQIEFYSVFLLRAILQKLGTYTSLIYSVWLPRIIYYPVQASKMRFKSLLLVLPVLSVQI